MVEHIKRNNGLYKGTKVRVPYMEWAEAVDSDACNKAAEERMRDWPDTVREWVSKQDASDPNMRHRLIRLLGHLEGVVSEDRCFALHEAFKAGQLYAEARAIVESPVVHAGHGVTKGGEKGGKATKKYQSEKREKLRDAAEVEAKRIRQVNPHLRRAELCRLVARTRAVAKAYGKRPCSKTVERALFPKKERQTSDS